MADLLDRFRASDVDDAGDTKYYGFIAMNSEWYLLREDTIAKNYRYVRGQGAYPTAWTNRTTLEYNYFDVVF